MLAVVAIIVDFVNYSDVSGAGFAYALVIVFHALIATAACYLMYKTYLQAIQLSKSTLAFHDFLIKFRQSPKSMFAKRHLPPMEVI